MLVVAVGVLMLLVAWSPAVTVVMVVQVTLQVLPEVRFRVAVGAVVELLHLVLVVLVVGATVALVVVPEVLEL
jgi:hypothetical protein